MDFCFFEYTTDGLKQTLQKIEKAEFEPLLPKIEKEE